MALLPRLSLRSGAVQLSLLQTGALRGWHLSSQGSRRLQLQRSR